MSAPFRRAAVATAAIAGLALSLPGLAGAQNVIPGDTNPGKTIVTGQPGVTVTLDEVDRVTGKVSGTIVNESGMNLNCQSANPNPNLNRGATVSTAEVVRASMSYYTLFQSGQSGGFNVGSSIPLMGPAGANAQFWPLLQLLPTGSVANYLSDGAKEAATIGNAHAEARQRGMVGELAIFNNFNNGQTRDWDVTLGPQSIGARGTDPLGVMFVCRVGNESGQHYAWAGYEEVEEVPDTGSLSSLSSGSLAPSAPAPGPDVDDDVDNGDDDDVVSP